MNRGKLVSRVIKGIFWSLLILTAVIYHFISKNDSIRNREELALYKAKFEGSLLFIKDYKNGCDSLIQQKNDSIELLTEQLKLK